MFLDLIRYIRYVCKSAHRIVCENMCWSLTNRVRWWYPLTGLYVRICDVYMWYCALINYLYMFSNNFKIWIYIYICVCVCVCSVVPYMFGKIYRIFWVKLWSQTRALFDSILLYIVYNCLLDVWLTPSITIFHIKV